MWVDGYHTFCVCDQISVQNQVSKIWIGKWIEKLLYMYMVAELPIKNILQEITRFGKLTRNLFQIYANFWYLQESCLLAKIHVLNSGENLDFWPDLNSWKIFARHFDHSFMHNFLCLWIWPHYHNYNTCKGWGVAKFFMDNVVLSGVLQYSSSLPWQPF